MLGLAVMLAVMLAVAAPLAVLQAQPAAAGDAEWLSRCQENDWGRSDRARVCEMRVERLPHPTTLTVDGRENGGVTIMDVKAVNGPVSLRLVGGDVHARSENGPIDVAFKGARWDGAGLDAETKNGPVELTLPARYAAHLETGTESGPMDVRFPITLQGDLDTRHLSMDIGGGGPPIRLITTNGPVTLRHTSD